MKMMIISKTVKCVFTILLISLMIGCAVDRQHIHNRNISFIKIPSDFAEISKVYLHTVDGMTQVSGEIGPSGINSSIPHGHVVIEVLNQQGDVIEVQRTHYHLVGKFSKKKRRYHFHATLSAQPSDGSVIRVKPEIDERKEFISTE